MSGEVYVWSARHVYCQVLYSAYALFSRKFWGDGANMLLSYVLCGVVWQRKLESPSRNEVEEVDFGRGAIVIVMTVVVSGLRYFHCNSIVYCTKKQVLCHAALRENVKVVSYSITQTITHRSVFEQPGAHPCLQHWEDCSHHLLLL
jgi:hypothetical protein